uniref:NTR domain-containing protein n=1 Tax=Meloidogyne javanica TaxID=6303 RepID=A0A915MU24_MELJA
MKLIIFCCFAFIVLKQLIIIANACTCLPATIEENYCGSDWAAHILPLKRENINETGGFSREIRYTDKICQQKRKKDFVYTASQSAACGVNLEIGKEYLIGGKYFDGNTKKIIAHLLILGSETKDKQQQYNVKYLKVYRDIKGILNETNLVYFYAQFPACGIYLKEETEYLIFGSYRSEEFPINLNKCLTNLEWNKVNEAFRKSLNNGDFDKICEGSEQNDD